MKCSRCDFTMQLISPFECHAKHWCANCGAMREAVKDSPCGAITNVSTWLFPQWRLDAPAPPAWIKGAPQVEHTGKEIVFEYKGGRRYVGRFDGYHGGYMLVNLPCGQQQFGPDVARFFEIQLPKEPMEPQLPPHLETINVCSIGIPGDRIVPIDQLDAVRERARRCYNALDGIEDVEAFVAMAKERG